ncbi:DUF2167 domain-containing protein [Paraburkholderia dipogonis]|uniref:DUF2167 domain-containing protein n=1 Tax=Paraburkholderia dipogonis TaxID=1211383 RepID=A0ABW9B034_9BURK
MTLLKRMLAALGSLIVASANAGDVPCPSMTLRAVTTADGSGVTTISTALDGGADGGQHARQDASPQYLTSVIGSLHWIQGPKLVTIDGKATFAVPARFVFLGREDTDKLMELLQNPIERQYYLFSPIDFSWYGLISYAETGHISEHDVLNANELLEKIRLSTEASNKRRDATGWGRVVISGWRQLPSFDSLTKKLEWAVSALDADHVAVTNFNTRILGRTGILSVDLVADESQFETAVLDFRAAMKSLRFVAGQKYEDYRQGDQMASYGMSQLVANETRPRGDVPLSEWGLAMFAAMSLIAIGRKSLRRRK